MAKRVNQADGEDLILTRANNLYEGVTSRRWKLLLHALKDPNDTTPI